VEERRESWGVVVRDSILGLEGVKETIFSVLEVPRQCPLVLLVMVKHMVRTNTTCNFYAVGGAAFEPNFYVTIGRAACEACSATCNFWYQFSICSWTKENHVKVTLRPTISRPVRFGIRRPSETRVKFFFQTVTVCYFVQPSLTRGVCNLLLLLVLASAVTLGSALFDERSGFVFYQYQSIISEYVHKVCIYIICV
jgi:hypothetical protein